MMNKKGINIRATVSVTDVSVAIPLLYDKNRSKGMKDNPSK